MTDDEFIRVFEAAMVPHDGWTHEAHIRMAWIYCTREQSLSMAITKAGEGIRRLNETNGVEPELYHETVTGAFMRLVSLRIPELEGDWPQFQSFEQGCSIEASFEVHIRHIGLCASSWTLSPPFFPRTPFP
ncbi:MAG: hypothetical protein VCC01_10875, partial [Candidatus Hydrogenedentota bacterium]